MEVAKVIMIIQGSSGTVFVAGMSVESMLKTVK